MEIQLTRRRRWAAWASRGGRDHEGGGPGRRAGQRHTLSGASSCSARRHQQRTQVRIGRVHVRVASLRADVLHKATTTLAQRHQVIVVEDLNVAGMSRRKPGAGRGGRGLNRAIADAAPGELSRQLGYKTTWYGSRLVVADRWYPSSKTCSACGAVKTKLTLAERTWTCHGCGAVHDRDLNAAINLARLSEHATRVTEAIPGSHASPRPGTAGSGPVAGRGAIRKTSPPSGAAAGGDETSTPHDGQPAAGQTGTAPAQGGAT